ncbi:MAG: SAM-dependent methyltransferase [Opitutales bacterium]
MSAVVKLAERGCLSDRWIRAGVRQLLRERLRAAARENLSDWDWLRRIEARPPDRTGEAVKTEQPEIPVEYFQTVLGPQLKFSSAYWPEGCPDLAAAETAMLRLTCERAGVGNGQNVLDAGCGWGALGLWIAANHPATTVVCLSNSRLQEAYIKSECERRNIRNLRVVGKDIHAYQPAQEFDRILAVELFEHTRNHRELFQKTAAWLRKNGKLFIHSFSHRKYAYLFETKSSNDWLAHHFFPGGVMLSSTLLPAAAEGVFHEEASWEINGQHYSRTAEAWLARHDAARDQITEIFSRCYAPSDSRVWWRRWRLFYMAFSELFAYHEGKEWRITHHLLAPDKNPP